MELFSWEGDGWEEECVLNSWNKLVEFLCLTVMYQEVDSNNKIFYVWSTRRSSIKRDANIGVAEAWTLTLVLLEYSVA